LVSSSNGQRLADIGWIEWGGELIWVAGYTSGAPYGLRVCDFDRADLEAMGLDVEALDDAGLLTDRTILDRGTARPAWERRRSILNW
jgi:hypothetical protein